MQKMVWRNYSQTLFWKIKIKHISGSIFYGFIYFAFIICKVEDNQNWLKLSCRPLAFSRHKTFLNNKKRNGTSLAASFSAWFFEKNISLVVIFYYLTKFQCLIALKSKPYPINGCAFEQFEITFSRAIFLIVFDLCLDAVRFQLACFYIKKLFFTFYFIFYFLYVRSIDIIRKILAVNWQS